MRGVFLPSSLSGPVWVAGPGPFLVLFPGPGPKAERPVGYSPLASRPIPPSSAAGRRLPPIPGLGPPQGGRLEQRLRGRRMCVTGRVGRGREEARGNPGPAAGSPGSKITGEGSGGGAPTHPRGVGDDPGGTPCRRALQLRDGGLSSFLSLPTPVFVASWNREENLGYRNSPR